MKQSLEKLWNEYFSAECTAIETEEERKMVHKIAHIHEETNAQLTKEQIDAVDALIEAIYDMQSCTIRKSFFIGCEFAVTFLSQIGKQ